MDFITKFFINCFLSVRRIFLYSCRYIILFISMTPPKICSMEENNSQQFGNLISQQTTNPKTLLPPSAVSLQNTKSIKMSFVLSSVLIHQWLISLKYLMKFKYLRLHLVLNNTVNQIQRSYQNFEVISCPIQSKQHLEVNN